MKTLRTIVITIAVTVMILPGFNSVCARGGGHMGGGAHEGGWSGGRGGGDFGRGGGDFDRGGRGGDWGERGDGQWRQGGGDRPGPHDHGDHGDHTRHDNNNNTYNKTNNVNVYGGNPDWGWGWGAADDALAGMAVGAAIGAASQPSTIIVEQPSTTVVQPSAPAYGTQVTVLPAGCQSRNINGIMAYQCGSVWYRPYFGASGVYYEVVPPPPAQNN